jgi:hypothetical protein
MPKRKKGPARKPRLKTLLKADAEKLFGEPDIKKMLSNLVSKGMTIPQIAAKYNSTVVSVRDWLRRLELTPKSTRPDVTAKLVQLGYDSWDMFFRRNMTITHMDAAKMLNCHWTTVSHYRRLWVEGRKV